MNHHSPGALSYTQNEAHPPSAGTRAHSLKARLRAAVPGKRTLAGAAAVIALVPGVSLLAATSTTAAEVEATHTFTGAEGAATGSVVAQQGCDFTGDGREDIVTSAWMWDRAPIERIGAAYVIPNGTESGDVDDPTTGIIRIEGPQEDTALVGFSTSCAGDVNGDGFDDITIGEYMNNRVWVVFGSDDPNDQVISLEFLGDRGFAISRAGDNDRTGFFANGVGDVDGDGLDDVAVISLGAQDGAGQISIVKGRDDIANVDLDRADDVLMRVNGLAETEEGVEKVPSYVARVGDVNGDGTDDLAVGGYVATPDGAISAPGMAWVLTDLSAAEVNLDEDFAGFTINGPTRGKDRLGMSLTGVGDVNNDGFEDLLIGADSSTNSEFNGGAAVVLGSDSTETVTTDPQNAERTVAAGDTARGWWVVDNSEGAGSGMGYAVSAVPASDGTSGTLVIGEWGSDRAVAFDSSVLTGNSAGAANADGAADTTASTLIDIATLPTEKVSILKGEAGARLGRGVGIVNDYGDLTGPSMVAGADNVGGIGYVAISALPERQNLTPEPSESVEPSASVEPSEPGEPSASVEPSESVEPTSSPDTTQDDNRALPRTGTSIALGLTAALVLVGVGVLATWMTRRNKK